MVEVLVIVAIVEASPLSDLLNDVGHGALFSLWLLKAGKLPLIILRGIVRAAFVHHQAASLTIQHLLGSL